MIFEIDPIHIKYFSLLPVRGLPDRGNRIYFWLIPWQNYFYHEMEIERYRIQIISNLHSTSIHTVVQPCNAGKHIKISCGILVQGFHHPKKIFPRNFDRRWGTGIIRNRRCRTERRNNRQERFRHALRCFLSVIDLQ